MGALVSSVQILPHQHETLISRKAEVLLAAGIGAGKSHLGALWCIEKISEFPKCTILLAANTYSQMLNASVKTLTTTLDDLKIKYKSVLSGPRKRIEIGKATIMLYSLEKHDNIRGIKADFSWLDEVAFSCLAALNVVRGRMRGNAASYRQILMTSSLNGYNFLYDIFGNLTGDEANTQMVQAQTQDNIFLPGGYYEQLVELYGGIDSPLARQELFGVFVNLQEGAIFSMFERDINLKPCQLDKDHPVYVGIDFNVQQMSAVYCQYINGMFKVCKEVQLTHRDANTFDMGNRIVKDLGGFNVRVIPDSTGRARKTAASSGATDHQILRDLGLIVMETSNPLVRDRQNNMNIKFKKEQLILDPSCVKTIKEIETLSARDKEGAVSHLQVCIGYILWKLAPLRGITQKAKRIV